MVRLDDAVHRSLGRGEAVYLDRDQSVACRLFGCQEPSRRVMTTQLPEAPRVGLCLKHAQQWKAKEIQIRGLAGRPISTDNTSKG